MPRRKKMRVESPEVRAIQLTVAQEYDVARSDILSPRRNHKLVVPRHVAMQITRDLLPSLSLPDIAFNFKRKDHTTVLNALTRIEHLLKRRPIFKRRVELLKSRIQDQLQTNAKTAE